MKGRKIHRNSPRTPNSLRTPTEEPALTILTVLAARRGALRQKVLNHLGVRPGGKIVLDKFPGGRIEAGAPRPGGRISDVFDIFKMDEGPRLSIDQINDLAARGWAGEG